MFITKYEYEILPITGKSTFKVMRYKYSLNKTTQAKTLISKSTIATNIYKDVANEVVFRRTFKQQ